MKKLHDKYLHYGVGSWKMLGDGIRRVAEDIGESRIPKWYLLQSLSQDSNFVDFLRSFLSDEQVWGIMYDYCLGATNERDVIFWQVDFLARIRSGKIMAYHPQGHERFGHRDHAKKTGWVHSRLIAAKKLPESWRLEQCLFGEHLLHRHPGKDVALVEAEKTAVICSALFPDYVWLSCGGRGNLSAERCAALRGRTVTVFPDTDVMGETYRDWCRQSQKLKPICHKVVVSDVLERLATYEQKVSKIDIADLLVAQLLDEREQEERHDDALAALIAKNPAIELLVNRLDLEVVSV